MMTEALAGGLYRGLERAGVRCWLVGGWGVDALLGRCTRSHKDLDVLFALGEHAAAWAHLHERGYRLAFRWEENVDVPGDLVGGGVQPTAYVLRGPSGGEVDVHVLDDGPPRPRPLWSTDLPFVDGAIDAVGAIDGTAVRCMSAAMQLLAHEGYDLPPAQADDVALLEQLVQRDEAG